MRQRRVTRKGKLIQVKHHETLRFCFGKLENIHDALTLELVIWVWTVQIEASSFIADGKALQNSPQAHHAHQTYPTLTHLPQGVQCPATPLDVEASWLLGHDVA